MANKEHLEILEKGVEEWNNWRKMKPSIIPNLTGADLSESVLTRAKFEEVNFSNANLSNAKFSGVDLRSNIFTQPIYRFDDIGNIELSGINISRVNFSNANLSNTDFFEAKLSGANFYKANLTNADLRGTELLLANFSKANLSGANLFMSQIIEGIFTKAYLREVILIRANLSGSDFCEANLFRANLTEANLFRTKLNKTSLIETKFVEANLTEADFYDADMTNADLTAVNLIRTHLEKVIFNNCKVYGINVWDIKGKPKEQKNLIITLEGEPIITVDNLEVAQFIYLLLNNEKIRNVIGTIAKKGVLILGRFTSERKKILDAIREKLRLHDFVPMMFDFEKVESRDFTETIKILAGMSKFVIVDITNPKSSPLELQATIPDYQIPFLPIIQKGENPFSMFADLKGKYDWVLDVMQYGSEEELLEGFQKGIIDRALEEEKRLLRKKAQNQINVLSIKDFK